MRRALALLLVAAGPLGAQQTDPLAFLKPATAREASEMLTFREQVYHPVRPGEVRAAAFLTEGQALPFGELVGPSEARRVPSSMPGVLVMTHFEIAVRPPAGASYAPGDTLLLARLSEAPKGWGSIVVPTGLAVVKSSDPQQTIAVVTAEYGAIRGGQVVMPLMPFKDPGDVKPVKAEGPTSAVITGSETRELEQQGSELMIDAGRGAGMQIGDFVEFHSRPVMRRDGTSTVSEVMAVGQVVHVSDKSSTVRLLRILAPAIRAGTPAVRTATLPS
jgi:hypothetical protein